MMREVKADATFPVERLVAVEFAHPGSRPLLLDAVYPAGTLHAEPDGPRPVIVHAGEPWVKGQRSADPWYHAYFATHGFFAASCDVRAFAEAPFPAQLHDVKAALRWLRANAGIYGIDPDRIGIWGESIAATLAALVGLTGDSGVPELEGYSGSDAHAGYSTAVQAVVWASGGADFPRQWAGKRWQHAQLTQLLGGPANERLELAQRASPLHYARSRAPGTRPPPPFLLLHGTRDETTPFEPAVQLRDALRTVGADAELVPLLGRYHNWTGLVENPDERWRYWDLAPMALPFWIKHLRPCVCEATARVTSRGSGH
jgi:acetyl esterase/lipase